VYVKHHRSTPAIVQFLMPSMPMQRATVLTLATVSIIGGTTSGAREHDWGVVFAQTGAPVPQSVAPPVDQPTATLTFDVASVHLSAPSTDGHNHIWNDIHESHFRTGNLSIRDLIQYAYNLPKSQIVGGPGWLDSGMYDIDAKSSSEVDVRLKAMPDGDAAQQKRVMVRELLKERFSLTTHEETRVLPVYNLVLAKGGAKFQPSDHSGTRIDVGRSRIHVQGSDDTIGLLARELAQSQGRLVVNRTGLTGRYDLTLRWTPDETPLLNGEPDPNAPPGLFTAIQDQLGLKLESGKGPVPVLVIDHIEPPSAN
jgi:uncharacterized protein (TIGR03435 family)